MKNLLTFFLTFITFFAFSQIQNEKGKLILETNDTIVGSISYYDDFSSTVTYIDKNNNGNSCTIDCINEIILNNGIRYTTLVYPDGKDGKVFVQKVIESNLISLYASEENGAIYYYVTKGDTIYRLENNYLIEKQSMNKTSVNQVMKKNDNRKYSRSDNRYLGSLKMIMIDKPELFDKIDELKLNENDLIDIILEYNQGIISFMMTTEKAESKGITNWVAFGQYSHFDTYYFSEPTYGNSYGIFAGTQMYFTKSRRHSLKFSIGYSQYKLKKETKVGYGVYKRVKANAVVYDFEFIYEYIVFMTRRTNIYANMHIADFAHVTKYYDDDNTKYDSYTLPIPRFSPGVGIEYKSQKRFSFYCEVNHLLKASYIPLNFSFGIKYDIGKITGNYLN
ncbi:MAG: hypothetical protein HQ521_21845 [Bacteroidetes bacterium]|nr:hypothetical protein [Bacteroidota bacterium]